MNFRDLPARQALDAVGEVIFMTDTAGVFTFVNREFERLYGYAPIEVVGFCTPRILKGGHVTHDEYEVFWTRIGRGESVRETFVNQTRDGRLIEVEISVNPIRAAMQEIVGFIAVQRDVTAQNQAEIALKRSEARYRALAETATNAIFIVDAANRIEYLNPAAARGLGVANSPNLGRQLRDCFNGDLGVTFEQALDEVRRSDAPTKTERLVELPNGAKWLSTWIQPISWDGKASGSIMGVAHDVTQQHQLSELLERQNVLLNAIVDASPVGILLLNARTWTCDIANAAVRTFGARELVAGVPLAEGWPDAASQLVPLLELALHSDTSIDVDLHLLADDAPDHATGDRRFTASASRLQLMGRPPSVLVMLTEVTERLQLEEQLLQAQKMEAIGRLAGGVAHDFNNLLTPILGYSDLILKTLDAGDPRRLDVEEVCRAARSAGALTRQLLTFSRKQVTDPKVLNLNGVLEDINNILQRSIGEDVDVVHALDPELGQLRADRNQIEQVVMNIGVNARDAMPHGGVLTLSTANRTLAEAGHASRRQMPPGDYVVLSITDTGTGMTPEVLAHLFEPFYTTKEFGRGTGLGLSTVYGIVKECGGYITVDSVLKEGTTFTLYFPRVRADADVLAQPDAPRGGELPRGSETLLVVEDNDGLRRLAERVLTDLGYAVLGAPNAETALRLSDERQQPIDLLLTDIVMPGADGILLSQRLAVRRPDTRVLFMSGYSGRDLADRHTQMNGRTLLQKPFTPEALARAVRDAIDRQERSTLGAGASAVA